METSVLFGGLSLVLAFSSATCLIASSSASRRKRDVVLAAEGAATSRAGRTAKWLRNGFPATLPLADALLRREKVRRLLEDAVALLAERGYVATCRTLLSAALVAVACLSVAAGAVSGSVVGAFSVAACAVVAAMAAVGAVRDRRRDAMREAVPEVLRSMEVCFDSGLTLHQTFCQVERDATGPLRGLFARAAHMLETGGGSTEAIAQLKAGSSVPELAFIAVALDVQHQAGGSLKQVLAAARDMVEGELSLKRALRVQTAQAKLSARVVSVMPFALIALFSLVSEGFLSPFFESPAGYALLALAAGMQVAGICMVRRVLSSGVES